MEAALRIIDNAVTLGAHTVKIFAGMKASADHSPAEYQRAVAFAREMTEHLHQHGLTLTGETHANTLFDSRAACFRFLNDVGAPHFKICFQPYDFTDTGRALADYEAYADRVTHVHLQGRKNDAMSLLEEADIAYVELFQALAKNAFEGDFCLEFVKDCVVDRPEAFEMDRVLGNAQRDRDYVVREMGQRGIAFAV
jgi:sugar phosphate isomerase/epimerase